MTGFEKVMSMSLEELSQTGICPEDFGLQNDEELCEKMDGGNYCPECLRRALEMEV